MHSSPNGVPAHVVASIELASRIRKQTNLASRCLDALDFLLGFIPSSRNPVSQVTPGQNKISEDDIGPTQCPQALANKEVLNAPPQIIVSNTMKVAEIIGILKTRGCADVTHQLDHHACSSYAVSNGGFGDVYSGRLLDGIPVAIKVFRLHIVHSQSGKHLKRAAKELHTWSKCQHPNVLGLLGMVEFRGQIGMVSRWMNRGHLRVFLNRQPDIDRYQLCYDICNGLAYLHGVGIIHGDLKGANVLISDDGTALLNDFGNSVLTNQSLLFTQSNANSTISLRWTAPEVLVGSVALSYAADVFSLGMTLLETITGEVPYYEIKSDPAVMMAIVVNKMMPARPEVLSGKKDARSDEMWNLFTSCWAHEPELRPSAWRVRDLVLGFVQMRPELESPPPLRSLPIPRESSNSPRYVATTEINEKETTAAANTGEASIASDDSQDMLAAMYALQDPRWWDASLIPGAGSELTDILGVTVTPSSEEVDEDI